MRSTTRGETVGRPGGRRGTWALAAAVWSVAGTATAAQEPDPTRIVGPHALVPGAVVERVVSAADTARSWALYMPGRYDPRRAWPILFVMDPRGRALVPLERLIEPAERYGYIVMSSWDTASDFVGPDPNEPALAAMLDDAQTLFTLDGRRLYLVGFSGTVRAAWSLATRLVGHVAGIVGVGGGMPPAMYDADLGPLRAHAGFGFYGLAGTRDFNQEDLWRVEALLDRHGIANGLDFFDGPHAWAPAEHLGRAVGWMELRAMRTGLRPRDDALVDSLYDGRIARARRLEEEGRPVMAWREYDGIAGDFDGLVDVGPARLEATRLRGTRAVEEGLERRKRLQDRFWTVVARLDDLLFDVQIGRREPDPDRMAEELGLGSLLAEAADPGDPFAAAAAARLLEHIYVSTSFYQPRSLIELGRTGQALAMLEVAERIFPDRPGVCLYRARAFAAAEREGEALDALRCALDAGLPPDMLEDDPGLAPLRGLPGFRALTRSGGGGPGGRP